MTRDEYRKVVDTVRMNVAIHQSDGFQEGYAQAIADFVEHMADYAEDGDICYADFLNTLVSMGEHLCVLKAKAEYNIDQALERGYEERPDRCFVNPVVGE